MPVDITAAASPGFLRRLAAMVYDLLLLFGLLLTAATLVVIPVVELGGPQLLGRSWWFRLYLLAVIVGFYTYFWSRSGQTLGMRAWRLLLLREDGTPLGGGDALRRLAWAALTLAPAGIGFLWMLFDRDHRTWYDRLSGTRVVMTRKATRG